MFARAVHPGTILKDELEEIGIAPADFARQIDIPPDRVSDIIDGREPVTGDTALRLGHWFGNEPAFWMNLQTQFDVAMAAHAGGGAIRLLPTREDFALHNIG
jgi:addiction module HigA family antidote